MTILTDLRDELAGYLRAAGIETSEYVPEAIYPPLAIVSAASPYVQEIFDVKTFNHDYKVNLTLRLVGPDVNNESVTQALDDMIEKTLVALQGSWEVEIAEPFIYEANGTMFLAADATISTTITIK